MNLNQVTVPSTDVRKSIDFYRVLGLILIVESLPDYARFECPDGDATFSVHRARVVRGASEIVVYFECVDLDATVLDLERRGVKMDSDVQEQPWLWREAYLKDPDGNTICLFSAQQNRKYPPWRIRTRPSSSLHELNLPKISIRAAVSEDIGDIARVFLESAEYHAELDPERYLVPTTETISARYSEALRDRGGTASMTLVAELNSRVTGFVDVRLEQSPDVMHRAITYCQIAELAVSRQRQDQGIGGRLLAAAEDWGRRKGAEFACVEYLAANTRARAFYRDRMGYSAGHILAIKQL